MTGNGPSPLGTYTFRYKQSSEVLGVPPPAICAHGLEKEVAARGELQAAAGCGGFQRESPTGGAAYGMPRNLYMVSVSDPFTVPLSVVAVAEDSDVVGVGVGAGVVTGGVDVVPEDPPPPHALSSGINA
jgi:hypothetical protein